MDTRLTAFTDFMAMGGPAIWVLAAIAALTAGLILWKVIRLTALGAWGHRQSRRALGIWLAGNRSGARADLGRAKGLYSAPLASAFDVGAVHGYTDETRREEVARVAAGKLAEARAGLRGLELVATIAPLIGLLGTVLGMVSAFQALEAAGSRADPSALAGGIWEALLTPAVGMAVAIPASAALTWFESIADRAQCRIEDMATQVLLAPPAPRDARMAAE